MNHEDEKFPLRSARSPAVAWRRILILSLCFMPGLIYLVVSARHSQVEMFSRLYWEYAGRVLNRNVVVGYPEAVQHHPELIWHLPIGKAASLERRSHPTPIFLASIPGLS